MSKIYIFLINIIFLVAPSYGSFSNCGAIFLTIFPGTEAVGMGGAYVSIGSDATACYYNPGVLGFHRKVNVSIMNTPAPPGLGYLFMKYWASTITHDSGNGEPEWLEGLYPDMHYKYIGFVYPISKEAGSIGIAYDYLSTGKSVIVDENGDSVGVFTPYDYAISISYGISIRDVVGVGFTSKYIYSYVAPNEIVKKILNWPSGEDYSLAFDAGFIFRMPKIPFLSIGVAHQNNGMQIFDSPLPKLLRKGFSIEPVYLIDELFKNGQEYKLSDFINIKYSKDWVSCLVKSKDEKTNETWEASGWEITFGKMLSFRNGQFVDKKGGRIGKTSGIALKLGIVDFEMADDSDIYAFPTKNYRIQMNIHQTKIPPFLEKSKYGDLIPIFSSLIIPGAGHILKDRKEKGSILMISSIALGYATWELKNNGDNRFYIPLISLAGIYGYSIWDLLK